MNVNHPRFLAELVEAGEIETEVNGRKVVLTAKVVDVEPPPVAETVVETDSGVSEPPPDPD